MGKGRKAKPKSQLQAIGSWRGDRSEVDFSAVDTVISPPEHFNKYAVEAWTHYQPLLVKVKCICESDILALVALCEAWGDYREASENLKTVGQTITDIHGNTKINPMYRIKKDSYEHFLRLLPEFGLTPASRSKIAPVESEKETDARTI